MNQSTLLVLLGGVIIPIGLPAFGVVASWRAGRASLREHWLSVVVTGAFVAFVLLWGRWDVIGFYWRYVVVGAIPLAALSLFRRPAPGTLKPRSSSKTTLRFITFSVLPTLAVWTLCFWMALDRGAKDRFLEAQYPLHAGTYYVGQGGGSTLLNYHGSQVAAQRYALDILRLGTMGRRATGLYPDRLSAYAIYGDTVLSPVTGLVVLAVDGFPDLIPPSMDRKHPAGNHVVVRRDSVYVVLAHLQRGSIRVSAGDSVIAGRPVALVGNSGNTSEPHLHIHAVGGPPAVTNVDSLLFHGTAVPLRFNGRFLVRNDRFP